MISSLAFAYINRTPDVGDVEGAARRIESEDGVVEWWTTEEESSGEQEPTIELQE